MCGGMKESFMIFCGARLRGCKYERASLSYCICAAEATQMGLNACGIKSKYVSGKEVRRKNGKEEQAHTFGAGDHHYLG